MLLTAANLNKVLLCPTNPEATVLKDYFNKAHNFPKQLITQNQKELQKAFVAVPQDIWAERLIDLQEALQAYRITDHSRRMMVTLRTSGMTEKIDKLLDVAFLSKYDELIPRVLNDFEGFFPYSITRANQNLIIFEKMKHLELVKYVMDRM